MCEDGFVTPEEDVIVVANQRQHVSLRRRGRLFTDASPHRLNPLFLGFMRPRDEPVKVRLAFSIPIEEVEVSDWLPPDTAIIAR